MKDILKYNYIYGTKPRKLKEYQLDAKANGCEIVDMELYHRTTKQENLIHIIFLCVVYVLSFLFGMAYGISLVI